MKRNTQSATRNLGRSILALAVTMLTALSAHAAILYWDTNGTDAGAGTTPNGTWVTSGTNWNTVADGTGSAGTWANNDSPVFSAGTDATEATITVQSLIYTGSIHFDEGSYTMVGSTPTLNWNGGSSLTVDSDASVIFDSSLPVHLINGGTRNWTINGEARFEGDVIGDWNSGTIQKNGSETLVFDGDVVKGANFPNVNLEVYAGTAIVNGSWSAAERFDVYGGTLGGTGTISVSQHLYNQGGGSTIAPGDITGDRIGTLNVIGSLSLSSATAGSIVNLEVGTTADKLDATGTLTVSNTSTANVTNLGGIAITQDSSYTLIQAGSGSGMNSFLTVNAADPWTVTSKTATQLVIGLDGAQDRGDFDVQTALEFTLGTPQASGYIDLLNMQTETAYPIYLDIVGGDLSNLTDQLTADGITWSSVTGDYDLLLSLNSGTTQNEYLVWDFSAIDANMELAGVAVTLVPEPTSIAWLGLGGLVLVWRRRR